MESDIAAKEIDKLSPPLTTYLDAPRLARQESGKYKMSIELWRELRSMSRAAGIKTEEPPYGPDGEVELDPRYLLIFVRLARCWLDGAEFGRRVLG